jgi:hypothetical protein
MTIGFIVTKTKMCQIVPANSAIKLTSEKRENKQNAYEDLVWKNLQF